MLKQGCIPKVNLWALPLKEFLINEGKVIKKRNPIHLSRIVLITVADGVAVALLGEEELAVDCKLLIT